MTDEEMIYKALIEYENNHWETEDSNWQQQITRLKNEYYNRVLE